MAPPDSYPIQRAMRELRLGQGPPSPSTPPAPDEWLRRLGTLPLMHQPGEKWMYNTGSDVLGVLIARASGRPFETFLGERLFAPLGMKDTGFSVPPAKLDRLATSYWTNFQTGALELYDEGRGGQWSRPPAFPSGGAGLVSTIDDYLAFGRMMLDKGKHGNARILSRPAVETMTTDQLTPEQKAHGGLGAGFFNRQSWSYCQAVKASGAYGWNGGKGSSWLVDPVRDLVVIVLTQRLFETSELPTVHRDIQSAAYAALADS